ncbi:MAG: polyprenyl synthetase family protein [Thermomicrobiaceae bacterium]
MSVVGGDVTGGERSTLVAQTEAFMRQIVTDAEATARGRTLGDADLPLYDVIRYHLGWVDEQFIENAADPGKRIRLSICLLSTGAAGGDPEKAIPVAAAIELLHNFTLMHDDIQDRSELRRGRQTVWRRWGEAQAINAGDATFALSQIALFKSAERGIDGETMSNLATEFNGMTLQIVEGQVLDLGFAERWDVGVDDYLRMIGGKTAAIVAFAAWSGAVFAGRDPNTCRRFHDFGQLLGLGFQIRDDYLGIWGDAQSTGKQPGDDIRGRKQSIPLIMLSESLTDTGLAQLREIYRKQNLSESDVQHVTRLLSENDIPERVQALTTEYHDRAISVLGEVAEPGEARDALTMLAERLVDRSR